MSAASLCRPFRVCSYDFSRLVAVPSVRDGRRPHSRVTPLSGWRSNGCHETFKQ